MVTAPWLSSAVENVCDVLVGIVVFFSMSLVMMPPSGLDAERQRRHVEQQHVLDFTREHATLDGRADGDGFIRVHVLARLLAEEFLHVLLHERHARLATDEDDLGDVLRADAGVLQRDAAGLDGALDQLFDQRSRASRESA